MEWTGFRDGRHPVTLATILRHLSLRENGYEAIEKARRLSPDIVLLDFGLPGIDGETADQLRADAKTSATPIIAVTGFVIEE